MSDIIELEHKKVAKLVRVSAQESRNLRSALSFAKYSSPGVLARLLLEAFLFEDGDIHADWFVRERACTKGSFTKLRDRLVGDSWLHFRDDTKRYFPGVRLKPHLEAVKASKAVTFSDIERKADRSELAELDARKADLASLDAKADRTELDKKADRSELEETKMKLEATSSKLNETSSKLNETSSKLDETNSKLEATRRTMAEIAEAVRDLQEASIPPNTPAKEERRAKATLKIAASVQAN
mgnify:CR=1 FL=1